MEVSMFVTTATIFTTHQENRGFIIPIKETKTQEIWGHDLLESQQYNIPILNDNLTI